MIEKIRIDSLEELINQPRLVKYDTYEFDELSYTCLLVDIRRLLEENKKYKEVIDKAINYINNNIVGIDVKSDNIMLNRTELLDILKGVEDK